MQDSDLTSYSYKIGDSTLNCADPLGYSPDLTAAMPITDSLALVADGIVKICAFGKDLAGNTQTVASWISWRKNTFGPSETLTINNSA